MIDRVAILLCLQNVEFLHAFPFKDRRIITANQYDKVFVIGGASGSGAVCYDLGTGALNDNIVDIYYNQLNDLG
jgi:hypothetical protein